MAYTIFAAGGLNFAVSVADTPVDYNGLAITSVLDEGEQYYPVLTTNIESKGVLNFYDEVGGSVVDSVTMSDYAIVHRGKYYGTVSTGRIRYFQYVIEDRNGNELTSPLYTQRWGWQRNMAADTPETFVARAGGGAMWDLDTDGVTYAYDAGDADGFVSYDADSKKLYVEPSVGDAGEYYLSMTATTDSTSARSYKSVRIIVADDNTLPVIEQLEQISQHPDNATIRCVTAEPASVYMEYGATDEYGTRIDGYDELATHHWFSASGLSDSSTYHYRLVIEDENGNTYTSPDYTFTTVAKTVINMFSEEVGDTVELEYPETLDTDGATYVLQKDVLAKRSAFDITGSNMIFDLNGHTITYGDGPYHPITDWDFETGSGGWDLTNAPNMSIVEATYSGAPKTGSRLNSPTHSLYIPFHDGEGGAIDPQYAISTQTFTIEEDFTYRLALYQYGYVDGLNVYVTLELVDATTELPLDPEIKVSFKPNWDYAPFNKHVIFRPTSALSAKIKISVDGDDLDHSTIITNQRRVYIDDVTLTSAYHHGIIRGSSEGLSTEPDITKASTYGAVGNLIKNGTINQSATPCTFSSDAIRGLLKSEVCDIVSEVCGTDSKGFQSERAGEKLYIHDCEFETTSDEVSERHNQTAANIKLYGGNSLIRDNSCVGSPQMGINISSNSDLAASSEIAYNYIEQHVKVTNAYSIRGNVYAHHNDIISDYGQGLMVSGQRLNIHNNYVNIELTRPTQEYGWYDRNVGLQLRGPTAGDPSANICAFDNIYNNTIVVKSNIGDRDAAVGLSLRGCDRGISVHDNTIIAMGAELLPDISPETDTRAAAVQIYIFNECDDAYIRDNILKSNRTINWWYGLNQDAQPDHLVYIDNEFEQLAEDAVVTTTSNFSGSFNDTVPAVDEDFQISYFDYHGKTSGAYYDMGQFYHNTLTNITGDVCDNTYNLTRTYSGIAFNVSVNVAYATVKLYDDAEALVGEYTTDSGGDLELLVDFKSRAVAYGGAATETTLGPYTIDVSKTGYVTQNIELTSATERAVPVTLVAA